MWLRALGAACWILLLASQVSFGAGVASAQAIDVDLDPLSLWVASVEYVAQNWQLAVEYGRWADELQSQVAAAYRDLRSVSERYCALAAYHLTPWLTPAVYCSGFFLNVRQRHGRDNYQHDIAATLRFDLTTHWLIKIEGHFLRGTAQLDSALNDDEPPSGLTLNWTALLLKTTGYF